MKKLIEQNYVLQNGKVWLSECEKERVCERERVWENAKGRRSSGKIRENQRLGYSWRQQENSGRAAGNDRIVMSISRLGLRLNDITIVIRAKCRDFTLIRKPSLFSQFIPNVFSPDNGIEYCVYSNKSQSQCRYLFKMIGCNTGGNKWKFINL